MSQPFDAKADLADSPDVGARVRPRDAATLILVRKGSKGPEVLMGRRAPGHIFMASKWVFPGGRVERGDYTAPFISDLPPAEMARLSQEVPERQARALALAAVRETHEETGVILGRPAPKRSLAGAWRAFAATGHQADLSELTYIARAVTPPGRPRRFDARFFLADADAMALPARTAHGDELERVGWVALDDLDDLALPAITRFVMGEVEARMDGRDPGLPFVRQLHGRHRIDRL
jgi:8-oxo-dGTP pyrophosphatase MutT (NUDIX family)